MKSPESLVTQLDVYTEEKFEDEEDMRERTRAMFKDFESGSDFDNAFSSQLRRVCLSSMYLDVHMDVRDVRDLSDNSAVETLSNTD